MKETRERARAIFESLKENSAVMFFDQELIIDIKKRLGLDNVAKPGKEDRDGGSSEVASDEDYLAVLRALGAETKAEFVFDRGLREHMISIINLFCASRRIPVGAIRNSIGKENNPGLWESFRGGNNEFNRLLEYITGNLSLQDALILKRHHNNLTCWFRDVPQLSMVFDEIRKMLARKLRNSDLSLNIWSAGCSSGQEAYSLAILAKLLFKTSAIDERNWDIRVIATDYNPVLLDMAKSARYAVDLIIDGNHDNGIPGLEKRKIFLKLNDWFEYDGSLMQPKEPVRKLVNFRYLNILDPKQVALMRDFDLIFCRNVFLWYEKPEKKKVFFENFSGCLAPGGYLCAGPDDLPGGDKFEPAGFSDLGQNVFRKDSADGGVFDLETRTIFRTVGPSKFYILKGKNGVNYRVTNEWRVGEKVAVKIYDHPQAGAIPLRAVSQETPGRELEYIQIWDRDEFRLLGVFQEVLSPAAFDQLKDRNILIRKYRLAGNEEVRLAKKFWGKLSGYAGKEIMLTIDRGVLTRIKIDGVRKVIQLKIVKNEQGVAVDSFYDWTSKGAASQLDRFSVDNLLLDSQGGIKIFGVTYQHLFPNFPASRAEIWFVRNPQGQPVAIAARTMNKKGKTVSFKEFNLLYDDAGKIINSFYAGFKYFKPAKFSQMGSFRVAINNAAGSNSNVVLNGNLEKIFSVHKNQNVMLHYNGGLLQAVEFGDRRYLSEEFINPEELLFFSAWNMLSKDEQYLLKKASELGARRFMGADIISKNITAEGIILATGRNFLSGLVEKLSAVDEKLLIGKSPHYIIEPGFREFILRQKAGASGARFREIRTIDGLKKEIRLIVEKELRDNRCPKILTKKFFASRYSYVVRCFEALQARGSRLSWANFVRSAMKNNGNGKGCKDGGQEKALHKGILDQENSQLIPLAGAEENNFDRIAEYLKSAWGMPDLRVYDSRNNMVFYNYIKNLLFYDKEMYDPEKENLKPDTFKENELSDIGVSIFGDFILAGLLSQWLEMRQGDKEYLKVDFISDIIRHFGLTQHPVKHFEYPLISSPMASGIPPEKFRDFVLPDEEGRQWKIRSWNTLPRHWVKGLVPEFQHFSVVDNGIETLLYDKASAQPGEEVREASLSANGKKLVIIKNTGLRVIELDNFTAIMEISRNCAGSIAGDNSADFGNLASRTVSEDIRRFKVKKEVKDGGIFQKIKIFAQDIGNRLKKLFAKAHDTVGALVRMFLSVIRSVRENGRVFIHALRRPRVDGVPYIRGPPRNQVVYEKSICDGGSTVTAARVNPYVSREFVTRGLFFDDALFRSHRDYFGGCIEDFLAQIHAQSGGGKNVLIIGAGAGVTVKDIRDKFPGLGLYFINKEEINIPAGELAAIPHFRNTPNAKKELAEFLDYFFKNILYHDVETGLPFAAGTFACVLVTSSVEEYIQDKEKLFREVKRVLARNAAAFFSTLRGLHIEGMSLDDFFVRLGDKYRYRTFSTYGNLGGLKIINGYPEREFPLLDHVTVKSGRAIVDFPQAPQTFDCYYRLKEKGKEAGPTRADGGAAPGSGLISKSVDVILSAIGKQRQNRSWEIATGKIPASMLYIQSDCDLAPFSGLYPFKVGNAIYADRIKPTKDQFASYARFLGMGLSQDDFNITQVVKSKKYLIDFLYAGQYHRITYFIVDGIENDPCTCEGPGRISMYNEWMDAQEIRQGYDIIYEKRSCAIYNDDFSALIFAHLSLGGLYVIADTSYQNIIESSIRELFMIPNKKMVVALNGRWLSEGIISRDWLGRLKADWDCRNRELFVRRVFVKTKEPADVAERIARFKTRDEAAYYRSMMRYSVDGGNRDENELIRELNSRCAPCRLEAAKEFGWKTAISVDAVAGLIGLLVDECYGPRQAAKEALVHLAAQGRMKEAVSEALKEAEKNENPEMRQAAGELLRQMESVPNYKGQKEDGGREGPENILPAHNLSADLIFFSGHALSYCAVFTIIYIIFNAGWKNAVFSFLTGVFGTVAAILSGSIFLLSFIFARIGWKAERSGVSGFPEPVAGKIFYFRSTMFASTALIGAFLPFAFFFSGLIIPVASAAVIMFFLAEMLSGLDDAAGRRAVGYNIAAVYLGWAALAKAIDATFEFKDLFKSLPGGNFNMPAYKFAENIAALGGYIGIIFIGWELSVDLFAGQKEIAVKKLEVFFKIKENHFKPSFWKGIALYPEYPVALVKFPARIKAIEAAGLEAVMADDVKDIDEDRACDPGSNIFLIPESEAVAIISNYEENEPGLLPSYRKRMLEVLSRDIVARMGQTDGGTAAEPVKFEFEIGKRKIIVYANRAMNNEEKNEIKGLLKRFSEGRPSFQYRGVIVDRGPPGLLESCRKFERAHQNILLYSIVFSSPSIHYIVAKTLHFQYRHSDGGERDIVADDPKELNVKGSAWYSAINEGEFRDVVLLQPEAYEYLKGNPSNLRICTGCGDTPDLVSGYPQKDDYRILIGGSIIAVSEQQLLGAKLMMRNGGEPIQIGLSRFIKSLKVLAGGCGCIIPAGRSYVRTRDIKEYLQNEETRGRDGGENRVDMVIRCVRNGEQFPYEAMQGKTSAWQPFDPNRIKGELRENYRGIFTQKQLEKIFIERIIPLSESEAFWGFLDSFRDRGIGSAFLSGNYISIYPSSDVDVYIVTSSGDEEEVVVTQLDRFSIHATIVREQCIVNNPKVLSGFYKNLIVLEGKNYFWARPSRMNLFIEALHKFFEARDYFDCNNYNKALKRLLLANKLIREFDPAITENATIQKIKRSLGGRPRKMTAGKALSETEQFLMRATGALKRDTPALLRDGGANKGIEGDSGDGGGSQRQGSYAELAPTQPRFTFMESHEGILEVLREITRTRAPPAVMNFDSHLDSGGSMPEGRWIDAAKKAKIVTRVMTCPRNWRSSEALVVSHLRQIRDSGTLLVISFCFAYFSLGCKDRSPVVPFHHSVAEARSEIAAISSFINKHYGAPEYIFGAYSRSYLNMRADQTYVKELERAIVVTFTQGSHPALEHDGGKGEKENSDVRRIVSKCLVVDCDGVLWDDIVGEVGFDKVKFTHGHILFQRAVQDLRDSGVLLAMNSKNNPDDVERVFWNREEMVLVICDFISTRVNWLPKDQNLREIAKELNIGLDSLVFIDDSPREIELIRRNLPEVIALQFSSEPAAVKRLIEELYTVFKKGPVTDEDKRRAELYQTNNIRKQLKAEVASPEEYLCALDLRIIIREGKENLPYAARIAQLTQRTNQFNLTGARFTEEQISGFIRSLDNKPAATRQRVYSLEMRDKFGDNGIVGAMVLAQLPDGYCCEQLVYRCRIEGFYLSCRAIGLTLEDALMAWVVKRLIGENVRRIEGRYYKTERNGQVENLYSRLGFPKTGENSWEALLPVIDINFPDWIRIVGFVPTESRQECGWDRFDGGQALESRTLAFVLVLTAVYMVVEIVGGAVFNSLALTADAGHMATDLAGLVCAFTAQYTTERYYLDKKYCGNSAVQLISASLNSLFLLVTGGYVLFNAAQRYFNPLTVGGWGMLAVALGGLLVNIYCVSKLHDQSGNNLTMEGAYLHALGDMLSSIGAVAAGALIVATGLSIFDLAIISILAVWLTLNGVILIRKVIGALRNTHKAVKGSENKEKDGGEEDAPMIWFREMARAVEKDGGTQRVYMLIHSFYSYDFFSEKELRFLSDRWKEYLDFIRNDTGSLFLFVPDVNNCPYGRQLVDYANYLFGAQGYHEDIYALMEMLSREEERSIFPFVCGELLEFCVPESAIIFCDSLNIPRENARVIYDLCVSLDDRLSPYIVMPSRYPPQKSGFKEVAFADVRWSSDGGDGLAHFFELMDMVVSVKRWERFADRPDAKDHPNLEIARITDVDQEYNCIAWSLRITDEFMGRYRQDYDQLYLAHGYIRVKDEGNAIIALYELDGKVTHAALRFSNNWWESKLGRDYRVLHTLEELRGGIYGEVTRFYGQEKLDGGKEERKYADKLDRCYALSGRDVFGGDPWAVVALVRFINLDWERQYNFVHIGSGKGDVIGAIGEYYPHVEAIGFDCAGSQTGAANEWLRGRMTPQRYEHVNFIRGIDFAGIGIKAGWADAVLVETMEHLARPRAEAAFSEYRRILKNSGSLIINLSDSTDFNVRIYFLFGARLALLPVYKWSEKELLEVAGNVGFKLIGKGRHILPYCGKSFPFNFYKFAVERDGGTPAPDEIINTAAGNLWGGGRSPEDYLGTTQELLKILSARELNPYLSPDQYDDALERLASRRQDWLNYRGYAESRSALVADADYADRITLAIFLQEQGFSVVTSESIEAVRDKFEAARKNGEPFDLVCAGNKDSYSLFTEGKIRQIVDKQPLVTGIAVVYGFRFEYDYFKGKYELDINDDLGAKSVICIPACFVEFGSPEFKEALKTGLSLRLAVNDASGWGQNEFSLKLDNWLKKLGMRIARDYQSKIRHYDEEDFRFLVIQPAKNSWDSIVSNFDPNLKLNSPADYCGVVNISLRLADKEGEEAVYIITEDNGAGRSSADNSYKRIALNSGMFAYYWGQEGMGCRVIQEIVAGLWERREFGADLDGGKKMYENAQRQIDLESVREGLISIRADFSREFLERHFGLRPLSDEKNDNFIKACAYINRQVGVNSFADIREILLNINILSRGLSEFDINQRKVRIIENEKEAYFAGLVYWYLENKQELDPFYLAAGAYERIISRKIFWEGNHRSALLFADFILLANKKFPVFLYSQNVKRFVKTITAFETAYPCLPQATGELQRFFLKEQLPTKRFMKGSNFDGGKDKDITPWAAYSKANKDDKNPENTAKKPVRAINIRKELFNSGLEADLTGKLSQELDSVYIVSVGV